MAQRGPLRATRIDENTLRVRVILSGEVKESCLKQDPSRMKSELKEQWLKDLAASIDGRDFENPIIHSKDDAPASTRLTDIVIELCEKVEHDYLATVGDET